MTPANPSDDRLKRLRGWRTRPDADLSLSFLGEQFKKQVERPYKQLGRLGETWVQLVPAELVSHTRLEGLSRGVLRVAVDSSAHLYELDRLLRQSLFRELSAVHKNVALNRVQLRLVRQLDGPLESKRRPRHDE